MKTKKNIVILFFLSLFYHCSNIEPVEQSNSPSISQFIYENYNTTITPNSISIRRIYNLENNRIISSTLENLESGFTSNRTYSYSDNRISEIYKFDEGTLVEKRTFNYDNNGNLIEYLKETINNSNAQNLFIKENYNHTQDTIFGITSSSLDGLNYETISTSKRVLDNFNNLLFLEQSSELSDETTKTEFNYDIENNRISRTTFSKLDNGNFANSLTNLYTYQTGTNTLGIIYDKTFGRQLLMLSDQHIDNSTAINNYNSKYLTTNTMESFSSSFFGNGDFSPEFVHNYNDNNYSIFSEYKLFINQDLFTRFTYEFIFQ